MRYSNHEYWWPRSTKVVSVVVGLCLCILGAYFGTHYSGKTNDSSSIYRKALADKMAILTQMIETENNPTGDSSVAFQSLVHEHDQLSEVAKNAVEQRNRFGPNSTVL